MVSSSSFSLYSQHRSPGGSGGGLPPPSKRRLNESATLAEEIIAYSILPRLPFKSLCRFSSVCVNWNGLISAGHDQLFLKLRPDYRISTETTPTSAAMVSVDKQGDIKFLRTLIAAIPPAPLPVGSRLADDGTAVIEIMASTNGLLCLFCRRSSSSQYLYLCNPATGEPGHRLPLPPQFHSFCSIGLALLDGYKYTLVHPFRRDDGPKYRFNVFSSLHRSEGWISSDQVLEDTGVLNWTNARSVFAHRCLYFHYPDYVFWFRCCDEAAVGYTPPPPRRPYPSKQEIGVCGELVTLAQTSPAGFEVWALKDNATKYWEQMYRVSLACLAENNGHVFSRFLNRSERRKTNKEISDGLTVTYDMLPLSFSGGSKAFFILSHQYCPTLQWRRNLNEKALLSFDMKNRKLTEVFGHEWLGHPCHFWSYSQSSSPLPN